MSTGHTDDGARPIIAIHPSFGDEAAIALATAKLEAAGYVVLHGDPAAIRAIDVMPVGEMALLSQCAFEAISEADINKGPRTLFGTKVAGKLARPAGPSPLARTVGR